MGGDHYFRRLLCQVGILLQHRGDADVAIAQDVGDLGQNSRTVGDAQAQVILAFQVVNGLDAPLVVQLHHRHWRALLAQLSGYVHQVSHHRAGGGAPAGAHTVKKHLASQTSLHLHRVVHPVYFGQHMVLGHQGRVDPCLDGSFRQGSNGQGLDGVPQLLGVAEVLGLQAGDTLAVDVFGTDPCVEGQGGQDGQLVGGIVALHVVGGVGLGVAVLLGFPQGLTEVGAVVGHTGEDVVGGAVDDGSDGANVVGQQLVHQAPNDGDAPADAGLKKQVNSLLLRQAH